MNFFEMNVKEIRRKNLRSLINDLVGNGVYDSQEDFAKAVGIDKTYLSQMLMNPDAKGARGVSENKARQIETSLSLRIGYLDGFGDNSYFPNSEVDNKVLRPIEVAQNDSSYVVVPVFDIKAACGTGYTNQEELIKSGLVFKETFLRKKGLSATLGDSGIIFGDGDSMSPNINHNDAVLVDLKIKTLDEVVSGKTYAFVANKELRIKRLFKNIDGSVRISSDNSDKSTYPDEHINQEDLSNLIQICGRVVWRGGEL